MSKNIELVNELKSENSKRRDFFKENSRKPGAGGVRSEEMSYMRKARERMHEKQSAHRRGNQRNYKRSREKVQRGKIGQIVLWILKSGNCL